MYRCSELTIARVNGTAIFTLPQRTGETQAEERRQLTTIYFRNPFSAYLVKHSKPCLFLYPHVLFTKTAKN